MKTSIQFWLVSGLALCTLAITSPTRAQIVPDATLPNNSNVTPDGNTSVITGGTAAGSNLFHSFEQFSILTGSAAYFNNALDIQNIISRVTGSSISNIDGLLRANGTANLFLLNPNGIIFSPNATLSIGGSFLGTTATSLNFADGSQFSATTAQTTPLLTVSVPVGLQFGGTAGAIRVQGGAGAVREPEQPGLLVNRQEDLFVQPSKTLALVGSGVGLSSGILTTDGGRIELGSVAGSSLVSLTAINKGWALGYEGVQNFGDIQLSGAAAVDASGAGGGDIQVQGRQITLTDGSRIEASTLGAELGGTFVVRASESVELIGSDGQFGSSLNALVYPSATGTGSNLTVETGEAGRVIIRDGAQGVSTTTFGNGNSGDLTVKTGQLVVQDGGRVEAATATNSNGQGGTLAVTASESVELIGVDLTPNGLDDLGRSGLITQTSVASTGDAGDILVETRRLSIRDGARISTLANGTGDAGNLTVRASESVELIEAIPTPPTQTQPNPTSAIRSSLVAGVDRTASGDGGDILVETRRLSIRDGATIDITTFGTGAASNLTVRASESVELSGTSANPISPENSLGRFSSLRAETGNPGDAGNLRIETGQLTVRDGAQVGVSSRNRGSGSAGNLEVAARSILLDNQGSIRATSRGGNQGNIRLDSQDLVLRNGSFITTNATGTATGGNITIDTDNLVALENSDIRANAVESFGGRIFVNAQGIFGTQFREGETPESDITAISAAGPQFSGIVELNTPEVDPSQGLVSLPTELIDASNQIANSCAADAESVARNEFTVTGRGGLPPSPTEPLNGETVLTNWATLEPEVENRSGAARSTNPIRVSAPTTIVEAQGWTINNKGEVILTAQAPTATPHSPWMASANCHAPENSS